MIYHVLVFALIAASWWWSWFPLLPTLLAGGVVLNALRWHYGNDQLALWTALGTASAGIARYVMNAVDAPAPGDQFFDAFKFGDAFLFAAALLSLYVGTVYFWQDLQVALKAENEAKAALAQPSNQEKADD